jgi:hypothetical protein
MSNRVRTHSYHQSGNQWRTLIEVLPGELREVFVAMQPGGAEAFLQMPEREGLYSGPRGPGKSLALCLCHLMHVGMGWGAGWRGILIRQTMGAHTELKNLLEQVITTVWPHNSNFHVNNNEWRWGPHPNGAPGGEYLKLAFLDGPTDYKHYVGNSWPVILFDELTLFADDTAYRAMLATNRSTVTNIPLIVRSTANPGGPGHNWVRQRFNPPAEPREGYKIGPRIALPDSLSRRAVCSVLRKNQRLMRVAPTYENALRESATGAGQLESWLYGSWNIAAGGLFEAAFYDAAEHFIIDPLNPQKISGNCKIITAMDYGEDAPFAYLWAYVSEGEEIDGRRFRRGDVIIFAELYGCVPGKPNTGVRWTVDQIKDAIIEREMEMFLRYRDYNNRWIYRVSSGIGDDMMFNADPNAYSIAGHLRKPVMIQGMGQRGVHLRESIKGAGSRIAGWAQIRGLLMATVPGESGYRKNPGLFITRDCVDLLRTLRELPRDPKKPEDSPRAAEDHLPDCCRYLLGRSREPRMSTYSLNDRSRGRAA